MNSKERTRLDKMDLRNILSVTHLFILITISGVRSLTVALTKSAEKGQLGNNSLSLFCDYTLSAEDHLLNIDLKRKRVGETGFSSLVSYFENNASHNLMESDLLGRTVLKNPTSAYRRAILKFHSIQCTDEADYRCEVLYAVLEKGKSIIYSDIKLAITDAPRIFPVGSDPDLPTYSEGLALLTLTCNAESNPPSNYYWTLRDGTKQKGYQLRLSSLTTNHTGRYTCWAYTGWGGQTYIRNKSVNIQVVQTTTPRPTTTIEPRTQKPWPSTDKNSASQQNADIAKGLKHQLQNNYLNPYDGHFRTLEGSQQYENLERTLKGSQPYDILERTL